jgi:protein KRI1
VSIGDFPSSDLSRLTTRTNSYILNRGWVDTEDPTASTSKAGRAAAFSEDEGDAEDAKGQASAHPWGALDEEDEFDEKAEEFETAYNFRFEEPWVFPLAFLLFLNTRAKRSTSLAARRRSRPTLVSSLKPSVGLTTRANSRVKRERNAKPPNELRERRRLGVSRERSGARSRRGCISSNGSWARRLWKG